MTEQFVRDEDGTFVSDKARNYCERWSGFLHNILCMKPSKPDPTDACHGGGTPSIF